MKFGNAGEAKRFDCSAKDYGQPETGFVRAESEIPLRYSTTAGEGGLPNAKNWAKPMATISYLLRVLAEGTVYVVSHLGCTVSDTLHRS